MGSILSSFNSKTSSKSPIAIIDLTNDSDTDDENQVWSEPSAIDTSITPTPVGGDIDYMESNMEDPQFADALNDIHDMLNGMNLGDTGSNNISEDNVNNTQAIKKQDGETGDTGMKSNAVLPKDNIKKVEDLDEKK